MHQDSIKVTGKVKLLLSDEFGNIKLQHEQKNLVVTSGKMLLASRLFSDYRTQINLTAIAGNGTVASATYATQPTIPFLVGQEFQIEENDQGVNGTYVVKTATTTGITFDCPVIASATSDVGHIKSLGNGTVTKMKIGSSDVATNLTQIDLGSPINSGQPLSSIQQYFVEGDASLIYKAEFPPNGSVTVKEAGLFTEEGKMLSRAVFPAISKASTDTLSIFWTITIS